jgi:hypothetical protein
VVGGNGGKKVEVGSTKVRGKKQIFFNLVDLQCFVIKSNSIESRFSLIQSGFNSIERQSN